MSADGFHITDQVCACGCDTRLNSEWVALGRRYLHGHRLRSNRLARAQGLDQMECLQEQEAVLVQEIAEKQSALGVVRQQLGSLRSQAAAVHP